MRYEECLQNWGNAIEHIADLEDLYLAEKRLVKNLNGKSKTFSLASVEAELDLAN
jgi:predicted DNA-binding protein